MRQGKGGRKKKKRRQINRKAMTDIKRERERLMDKSMGLYSASTVTSETDREKVNGDLSA